MGVFSRDIQLFENIGPQIPNTRSQTVLTEHREEL